MTTAGATREAVISREFASAVLLDLEDEVVHGVPTLSALGEFGLYRWCTSARRWTSWHVAASYDRGAGMLCGVRVTAVTRMRTRRAEPWQFLPDEPREPMFPEGGPMVLDLGEGGVVALLPEDEADGLLPKVCRACWHHARGAAVDVVAESVGLSRAPGESSFALYDRTWEVFAIVPRDAIATVRRHPHIVFQESTRGRLLA